MSRSNKEYIVGIDEAGRGPLAGPVAVGSVVVAAEDIQEFEEVFAGVRDSKKLSRQKREQWFEKLLEAKRDGLCDYRVSFISPQTIDKHGIRLSVMKGIKSCLRRLDPGPEEVHVMLDGGLKAPHEYKSQETIIRGDDKEKIISLASIAAKVLRDRKMLLLSDMYPEYGLDGHKGYGTSEHFKAVRKFGATDIHRKSFLKSLQK